MTSPSETEQTFLIGQSWNGLYRDRYSYDRETILDEAIRAWRLNPLARRLANLYKIYTVDGITFKCDHKPTQNFLMQFWTHDLNNMKHKLKQISDELFLTGNLFPLYSVDASGMSYFRIFPTDQIAEIICAPNDVEQEIKYIARQINMDTEPQIFDNPRGLPTAQTPRFMKHHAINQLVGTCWGEGEIWPDLPWLGRYASWLEDRVRLNRYRTAFMYVISGQYASETERKARENEINANPPRSGSVLVTNRNNGEDWGVLSAQLDAFDASEDGFAIKKMIAVNHVPLHYLAEPESSTTTTADAAGTPTFKSFESQQADLLDIVSDILNTVLKRRAEKDTTVQADAKIEVTAADASERDNAALALATSQIVTAIGELYDRELIDEQEYMRLVYRFAGEVKPADLKTGKGLRKSLSTPKPATASAGAIKTDAQTSAVTIKQPKN